MVCMYLCVFVCGKSWMDYRMTWNSSEFGGLEHVYVSAADVWTPDATLYNKSATN